MDLRTRTAALTLAVPLGLGLLTACGDDAAEPVSASTAPDVAETTSAPSTEPSTEPDTEPTTEPTSPPPASGTAPSGTTVPIYFTGDTPLGPRLYREFRQVEGDDPLAEAAALLVAGDALDPDYGTLLQGVTVEDVAQEAGAIVVTLGEDSPLTADKGTSPAEARLAVQSLVYTLQGTAQTRDPMRVQLADGRPADLFGQPTGAGVKAAPPLKVLCLVSLTTPQEGATASGTLAVEGVASSFEATVPYAVLDSSGASVLDGFATAEQAGNKLYPFATEVDLSTLAPGAYTLVARTDDPSDGEGPGPFEDTRSFTVE